MKKYTIKVGVACVDVTVYLVVVKANIFKDSSTSEWFNVVFLFIYQTNK